MLFGGLFSAYIFLRLGADYPWPVHDLDVTLGFINTIVLIASSVTVVMAWALLEAAQVWLVSHQHGHHRGLCRRLHVQQDLEYKAKFKPTTP
jgi:heme/copper-type cytochrome/quinol oxidase subunit 3